IAAFLAVVLAGLAGAAIGYGLVGIGCTGDCGTVSGLGALFGGLLAAGGVAALLRPLPEELPEPLPRLEQLALVAEEGVDLGLDVGADVDPAVRLQRARQVDGRDPVDLEAGGQLLREVVGVARPGGDGVERGPARHPVVGMVEVAVP